jgi:hypothetical protein
VRVQFRYQGAQVGGGSTNGPEYLGDTPSTWIGAQNNGNFGAMQVTFENGTTNPVYDQFLNVSFVVVSVAAFKVSGGIFVGAVVF